MEVKLESLEHASIVLTRLSRRMHKSVVGMFSPTIIPLNNSNPKVVFPCAGSITKISLCVTGATNKTPVKVGVDVKTGSVTNSITLNLISEAGSSVKRLDVEEDSVLELSIDPSDSSFIASLLFIPSLGNYKVEQYLLDNIESMTDEGIRSALDETSSTGTTDGSSQSTELIGANSLPRRKTNPKRLTSSRKST